MLREVRRANCRIDEDVRREACAEANREAEKEVVNYMVFDARASAAELWGFLYPRLNSSLHVIQGGISGNNGFELFRRICREIDGTHDRTEWQLLEEVERFSETKQCKSVEDTAVAIRELEKMVVEFHSKTGKEMPAEKLVNVVWRIVDEGTLDTLEEQDMDSEETTFDEIREFIEARAARKRGREVVRRSKGS